MEYIGRYLNFFAVVSLGSNTTPHPLSEPIPPIPYLSRGTGATELFLKGSGDTNSFKRGIVPVFDHFWSLI
jgi:hypothetical protein